MYESDCSEDNDTEEEEDEDSEVDYPSKIKETIEEEKPKKSFNSMGGFKKLVAFEEETLKANKHQKSLKRIFYKELTPEQKKDTKGKDLYKEFDYYNKEDFDNNYFAMVNRDYDSMKKGNQAFYCYGKRSNAFLLLNYGFAI